MKEQIDTSARDEKIWKAMQQGVDRQGIEQRFGMKKTLAKETMTRLRKERTQ